jgi:hypothetical protein
MMRKLNSPHISLTVEEKDLKTKLKKVVFYSCSEITIETNFNDMNREKNVSIENFELISHYEDKKSKKEIYYLSDDVYEDWKHPTILYYISKHIANYLEYDLALEISTLLRHDNRNEIEKWINSGCSDR